MLNDPLANMLSKILNCEKVGKKEIVIKPVSNIMKKVLEIMNDNHFVGEFTEEKLDSGNVVKVNLLGNVNNCGAIKPRFSVSKETFEKFEKRFLPAKDFGFLIVSTTKGIMTHIEAKKNKIGGRLLAFCY